MDTKYLRSKSKLAIAELGLENSKLKLQIEQQEKEIERLTDDNGQQHIEIMLLNRKEKQQAKYAELGRLALTTFNNADFDHCGENYNNNCSDGCEWLKFCQKRAELLGEVTKHE
jgi:hypothetical protein